MIAVYGAWIHDELPSVRFGEFLSRLPEKIIRRNGSYRKWQDRHRHLFGKLLFQLGMQRSGICDADIFELRYNEFERPSLCTPGPDFNISHSGNLVVCAVAGDSNTRVGIDTEEIISLPFSDYSNTMTPLQWESIFKSEDPLISFYNYWTIKESVIKADSAGLNIPLDEIVVDTDKAFCRGITWYLQRPSKPEGYAMTLASSIPVGQIEIQWVDFYRSEL